MITEGASDPKLPGRPSEEEPGHLNLLKDQFLASLNHEFRTPLSGILGMTDLLLESELTREQLEYVSTVRLCADQLLEMLNTALEYCAISAGTLVIDESEFNLRPTLEAVVAEHLPRAEAKGLKLSCRIDDALPEYVLGDSVRLRQLLSPLISNGVKFTSLGGVEVNASAQRAPNGELLLSLSVSDTGVGIPAEKIHLIFESFRQLESGLSRSHLGLGLGLAVAEKLVALMGGAISVVSQSGSGSTFTATLPLKVSEHAASAVVARVPQLPNGKPRILVVDDDDVARQVVSHILQKADYEVRCAPGGEEGITAASRSPFDLVLMDLQMPNVDGLSATAAIRRLPGYSTTPILALSANCSDEYRSICLHSGLQGFLTKPIQPDTLVAAVNRCLRSARPS